MIEGLILLAIASALLAAGPTHGLLTQRRQARDPGMARLLAIAFPPEPVRPTDQRLVALARDAEAALEADALSRGLRDLSATYDRS